MNLIERISRCIHAKFQGCLPLGENYGVGISNENFVREWMDGWIQRDLQLWAAKLFQLTEDMEFQKQTEEKMWKFQALMYQLQEFYFNWNNFIIENEANKEREKGGDWGWEGTAL